MNTQDCLRILDVAQDLKALSMTLNGRPFPFLINLAILASRREYLNLEKWLGEKIRELGVIFVAATVKFLQRKISAVMGPGPLKEDSVPKQTLPWTVSPSSSSPVPPPPGVLSGSQFSTHHPPDHP
jgi:CCR4-NOT transcription complex subunit 1